MNLKWAIIVLLLIWVLGWAFNFLGNWIHLFLIAALILGAWKIINQE